MDIFKELIAWINEFYQAIMDFVAGFEKEWGFEKVDTAE